MPRKPASRSRDYDQSPSTNRFGPKFGEPKSPWQILVEERRSATEQPIRIVATRAQIPSGTLFNWIRSRKGAPPRESYTSSINRRLAEVLGVTPEELSTAYNASAFIPLDPDAIDPAPAPKVQEKSSASTSDVARQILISLKSTGRASFMIEELETFLSIFIGPTQPPVKVKPLD